MHVAKQAVEDVRVNCNNILALIEAVDVVDSKQETLELTTRIEENLNYIKNSIEMIDLVLSDLFRKVEQLNSGIQEIVSEFDDIDMEED